MRVIKELTICTGTRRGVVKRIIKPESEAAKCPNACPVLHPFQDAGIADQRDGNPKQRACAGSVNRVDKNDGAGKWCCIKKAVQAVALRDSCRIVDTDPETEQGSETNAYHNRAVTVAVCQGHACAAKSCARCCTHQGVTGYNVQGLCLCLLCRLKAQQQQNEQGRYAV